MCSFRIYGSFASATNTLLAPMMIGLEVFGGHQMIAFLIICIFAYLVNGNKSIYTAQIKIFNKHYMMKGFTFCYFKDKIVMVMENGI